MKVTILLVVLGSALGWAQKPTEIQVFFAGDTQGAVEPCGCAHAPAGGLARRKVALLQQKTPSSLVLDAGNTLFVHPGVVDETGLAKAKLILTAMGQWGTHAMAVGVRDLNGGVRFLKEQAAASKVSLVSANLTDASGRLLFPPSEVVDVGGVKVGIVGVSFLGPAAGVSGVVGQNPNLALREAHRLRPLVDVVVLLAALPYQEALALIATDPAALDVALQAHDGRGALPPQEVGTAYLLSAGDRGRFLGKLSMTLGAQGQPFSNVAELEAEKALRANVEEKRKRLSERMDKTRDSEGRKMLQSEVDAMTAALQRHQKKIENLSVGGQKTLKLDWVTLGQAFPEDPQLKALAEKLLPEAD